MLYARISSLLTLSDSFSSLRDMIIPFRSRICFSFWISVVSSSCSSCLDSSVKSSNSFWQSDFLKKLNEIIRIDDVKPRSDLKCSLLSVQLCQLFPIMTFLLNGAKVSWIHHSHYVEFPMINLQAQFGQNQNIYGKLSIFVYLVDSWPELSSDAISRCTQLRTTICNN